MGKRREGHIETYSRITYRPVAPFGGEVYAEAGHDGRAVLQTHRSQMKAIRSHEVGGLRQVFGRCNNTGFGREFGGNSWEG